MKDEKCAIVLVSSSAGEVERAFAQNMYILLYVAKFDFQILWSKLFDLLCIWASGSV